MRYSDSSRGFLLDLYYSGNKDQDVQIIRPFPSFKNSHSQNEAKCKESQQGAQKCKLI